ncbi:MAG: hypothetical protein L6R37_006009 [Teloschistes peruensis]|nr:MAG: hypothetical protein L6R37_006009 [Teloschistes peruensis]
MASNRGTPSRSDLTMKKPNDNAKPTSTAKSIYETPNPGGFYDLDDRILRFESAMRGRELTTEEANEILEKYKRNSEIAAARLEEDVRNGMTREKKHMITERGSEGITTSNIRKVSHEAQATSQGLDVFGARHGGDVERREKTSMAYKANGMKDGCCNSL